MKLFGNKNRLSSFRVVVLLAAVVVALNIAASFAYRRFDLTQDNIYTLSPASQKVAGSFDDNVVITAYFSRDLPTSFLNLKQEIQDLLAEYKNNSKGKIKIIYTDPTKSGELETEAASYGVPKIQFNTIEKDKLQALAGYFGLVFIYGDKSEVIPVIESDQDLEYQITTNLKKLNQTDSKTIAWLQDMPEEEKDTPLAGPVADKYSLIKKELSQQYQLIEIDTAEEDFPELASAKALVVAGFNQDLSDKQKYAIDQFVLKGGALLYLKDEVIVKDGLLNEEAKPTIDDLVAHFGVKIEKNLVLDAQSGQASFSAGLFQFVTQYPFWPKINSDGFNQKSVITGRLESAVLPWASSLSSGLKEDGTETIFTPLVKSSKHSWLKTGDFNLEPQQKFTPASADLKANTLAGLISGRLTSYFSGQNKSGADFVSSVDNGRIIVVGDSDFLSDTFLRMYGENLVLAENLIDFSVQDEDLIGLRSRGVTDRPLPELSESEKSLIRYGNIFAMPLLVIVFGLGRFLYQSRSRTGTIF